MRKSFLIPILAAASVPCACFFVLAQRGPTVVKNGADPMLVLVNKNAVLLKSGDATAPTVLVHRIRLSKPG